MNIKHKAILLCLVIITALLCGCSGNYTCRIYKLAEYLDDDANNASTAGQTFNNASACTLNK